MSTPPPRGTHYVAPGQQKHLRACMVCSVVQLQTRFLTDGCPNCETHLLLAHNRDAIDECTSQVWEGLITLTDPATSWVARWQRLDGYVPGVYAVKVTGALPEERVMDLEGGGVVYIPRDGSAGNTD